jgi:hypothetical protein
MSRRRIGRPSRFAAARAARAWSIDLRKPSNLRQLLLGEHMADGSPVRTEKGRNMTRLALQTGGRLVRLHYRLMAAYSPPMPAPA